MHMKLHSTTYVEPFLASPGGLCYYDLDEWFDPNTDLLRNIEGNLADRWILVLGYTESSMFERTSVSTLIFLEKVYIVPYVQITTP